MLPNLRKNEILDFKFYSQANYQSNKKSGRRGIQTCDDSERFSPHTLAKRVISGFTLAIQEGEKVSKDTLKQGS